MRKSCASELVPSPRPSGSDMAGSSAGSGRAPAKYESERSEGGLAKEAWGSHGGLSFLGSVGVAVALEMSLDVLSVPWMEPRASGVCPACFVTYALGGASPDTGRDNVPGETCDGDGDGESRVVPFVDVDGARLGFLNVIPSNEPVLSTSGMLARCIVSLKDEDPFSDMLARRCVDPLDCSEVDENVRDGRVSPLPPAPRQNSSPVLACLEFEAVDMLVKLLADPLLLVGDVAVLEVPF